MNKHKGCGPAKKMLCEVINLPFSTYSYKSKEGRPGRKPSKYTEMKNGAIIPDKRVISFIEKILDHPFVDYGYRKITHVLRNKYQLIINPKKTYRLMKTEGLLQKRQLKKVDKRKRADSWKVSVSRPFEKLEIDIKYIYVHGEGRHYYMLNLIDCYTWKLLSYRVSSSIRRKDVIKLLQGVIALYGMPKEITLRSDNGSQFISLELAEFVKEAGITHEFCHVATPQENGHIECFHSILQRFLTKRDGIEDLFELEKVLKAWTEFYNEERPHKGCAYKTPSEVMSEYYEKMRENIGKKTA